LQHGMGCLSNSADETQLFGYWTDGEFSGTTKPQDLGDDPQPQLDTQK